MFTCLSLAIPILFDGTSSVIVEPAAIITSSPIVTGATKFTLDPIKALSPITVLCLFVPSKLQVIVPQPMFPSSPISVSPK